MVAGFNPAQLLARVFGVDVLSCPRCESRMQLISFIRERKAIVDILESLQMAIAPPEIAPACRTARQDVYGKVMQEKKALPYKNL
jgi:hypothetical protein